MTSRLPAQTLEMARRSLLQTVRQPAMIVPPIAFPLFLLAVNVGGLDAATRIPGFPTDSYLDFAISFAFMQGSLFAMINAGTQLARDVEGGFLKRLALTPIQRGALLVGNLAGVLAVALFSICVYMAVGFAAGMEMKSGPAGALVLVLLAMLVAVALAGLGALVGLRSGSAEAVQGFFPLFFVLFFLSSMNMPRNLIEADWFRTVATYNPISYLVEGVRSLIISGWDAEALALGFGIAAVVAVGAIVGAAAALRTRLVRT
jgi:ABC-2 type transport system permease protein